MGNGSCTCNSETLEDASNFEILNPPAPKERSLTGQNAGELTVNPNATKEICGGKNSINLICENGKPKRETDVQLLKNPEENKANEEGESEVINEKSGKRVITNKNYIDKLNGNETANRYDNERELNAKAYSTFQRKLSNTVVIQNKNLNEKDKGHETLEETKFHAITISKPSKHEKQKTPNAKELTTNNNFAAKKNHEAKKSAYSTISNFKVNAKSLEHDGSDFSGDMESEDDITGSPKGNARQLNKKESAEGEDEMIKAKISKERNEDLEIIEDNVNELGDHSRKSEAKDDTEHANKSLVERVEKLMKGESDRNGEVENGDHDFNGEGSLEVGDKGEGSVVLEVDLNFPEEIKDESLNKRKLQARHDKSKAETVRVVCLNKRDSKQCQKDKAIDEAKGNKIHNTKKANPRKYNTNKDNNECSTKPADNTETRKKKSSRKERFGRAAIDHINPDDLKKKANTKLITAAETPIENAKPAESNALESRELKDGVGVSLGNSAVEAINLEGVKGEECRLIKPEDVHIANHEYKNGKGDENDVEGSIEEDYDISQAERKGRPKDQIVDTHTKNNKRPETIEEKKVEHKGKFEDLNEAGKNESKEKDYINVVKDNNLNKDDKSHAEEVKEMSNAGTYMSKVKDVEKPNNRKEKDFDNENVKDDISEHENDTNDLAHKKHAKSKKETVAKAKDHEVSKNVPHELNSKGKPSIEQHDQNQQVNEVNVHKDYFDEICQDNDKRETIYEHDEAATDERNKIGNAIKTVEIKNVATDKGDNLDFSDIVPFDESKTHNKQKDGVSNRKEVKDSHSDQELEMHDELFANEDCSTAKAKNKETIADSKKKLKTESKMKSKVHKKKKGKEEVSDDLLNISLKDKSKIKEVESIEDKSKLKKRSQSKKKVSKNNTKRKASGHKAIQDRNEGAEGKTEGKNEVNKFRKANNSKKVSISTDYKTVDIKDPCIPEHTSNIDSIKEFNTNNEANPHKQICEASNEIIEETNKDIELYNELLSNEAKEVTANDIRARKGRKPPAKSKVVRNAKSIDDKPPANAVSKRANPRLLPPTLKTKPLSTSRAPDDYLKKYKPLNIPPHPVRSSNDGNYMMESVFLKYRPGMVAQYLKRWCYLTRTKFLYFTANPQHKDTIPTVAVPLQDIELVQRVYAGTLCGASELFQFEILLKQGAEGSFRSVQKEEVDNYKEPVSDSYGVWATKRTRSEVRDSQATKWSPEKKCNELLLVLDGAYFKSPEEKEEYRAYKEAHLKELRQVVVCEKKETLQNPSAWSVRESEWRKNDKRLLFASESEELCDNWVAVMNWAVQRKEPC
eukprot:TRINITY_DN6172_c0_g1_i1.p1 TRINITY_DN6172_c0_g1~~TRINITY_DN6172_c0_g1_i1.p1  ORF type:complete len:1314 (+),score=316.05 TRINITY_DN6172_c0_g1_i1:57-3998(+)